jgi:hypothetical protein
VRYLLPVARVLYALLGIGAVLIGVGTVTGGLSPGAHVDWISLALALVVGAGALCAAVWVTSRSPVRTLLASVGIAIVLLAALLPAYGLFGTQHGSDVIFLYLIPIVLDIVFSLVMAQARWSVRAMAPTTS